MRIKSFFVFLLISISSLGAFAQIQNLTEEADEAFFAQQYTIAVDLYKEAYTPWEWHEELFYIAKEEGIKMFSTPFDRTAVYARRFDGVRARRHGESLCLARDVFAQRLGCEHDHHRRIRGVFVRYHQARAWRVDLETIAAFENRHGHA